MLGTVGVNIVATWNLSIDHSQPDVTIDILRRIMAHYFGFRLNFVQNVTDVDDKIILRLVRRISKSV